MEEQFTIGEIVKPQGIRGELKIMPFTDSAEDFKKLKRVFLDGEEYRILSCRTADGAVYLGLRGVPDRNAAELLRQKKVVIPRADAPALPEGRYYIADLIGCAVRDEEGNDCGTVKTVNKTATEVYVLEKDGKEILFPAAAGVILNVDIARKLITVSAKRFGETAVL